MEHEKSYQIELREAIDAIQALRDEDLPLDERKLRLSELKERFRLLGLYNRARQDDEEDTDETESAALQEILGHLEPLGLAPAGTPAAELARLAALKITQK
jgi:hypothetical protein